MTPPTKRRILRLATALAGVVLLATCGVGGQAPPARQSAPPIESANENKTRRIWTNDDVESLGKHARVSVVGSMNDARPEKATVAAQPYARERDAAWYRERLVPLEAELREIDDRIGELTEYRSITRYMVGGVILPQLAGLPLNPEDQIKQFGEKRREVVREIEDLRDLARRNEILPGDIR